MGGLVTVKDRIIAIGGEYTNRVEEIVEQKWIELEPVPSSVARISEFSTLVINTTIYIFGKLI